MKANDFDKLFDEGKDITSYLGTARKVRVGNEVQRVNVDFPRWMVQVVDTRQDEIIRESPPSKHDAPPGVISLIFVTKDSGPGN